MTARSVEVNDLELRAAPRCSLSQRTATIPCSSLQLSTFCAKFLSFNEKFRDQKRNFANFISEILAEKLSMHLWLEDSFLCLN